jgi:signal transduction histidine kinase
MIVLRTPVQRYGFAALVIALTLVIRFLMAPLWETTAPFALFMLATVVTAWFAGTGPALLNGAAGLVIRLYFDVPVEGTVPAITWEEAVRLALFGGFIAGTAVVLERMKRDRRELERRIAAARVEIDERRRMEAVLRAAREEAEEANRLKDEFLSMVSHELRTPLNAILGWASLLRGGSLTSQRAAHAVDVIERNARIQAQLVADLLDVARSLSERLHLEPSAIDVVALAADATASLRQQFDEKAVTLVLDVPRRPLVVWGDATRLHQILVNLLGNGLKFTPRGGRVSLTVVGGTDQVSLVVSDTGEGIRPDFLPHVFERFTQGETGSTRPHGGLGLGLTIVRQLVDLHRGHIEVASKGKGLGATFTVRLPLHVGAQEPDDTPPSPGGARRQPELATERRPAAIAPVDPVSDPGGPSRRASPEGTQGRPGTAPR